MSRLALLLLALAALVAALAAPASASFIIGRDASHVTLAVDASGHAVINFSSGGAAQHVVVWGAVNALPPTRGASQVAFKVDYTGGSALHEPDYWKTVKNVCRPYTGPALPFYVAACDAPDGSYWALQLWQRMLPDLGYKPWLPDQSVFELHISHWSGPLPHLEIYQDWAWGGRYVQILGAVTYGSSAVYGFAQTSTGVPLDSWGRNVYLDTYDSAYGPGWSRENSFLAEPTHGAFCYSFMARPAYPGYPARKPLLGLGKQYRMTVLGPGVTPIISWQGPALGAWNPASAADRSAEQTATSAKQMLELPASTCHS